MRKRGVLAAMLTGVMLVLCGCGGMTTDEAKDYVKSALDAGYKAEFKEYAEITDSTEKEAKKEYETNLDNSCLLYTSLPHDVVYLPRQISSL